MDFDIVFRKFIDYSLFIRNFTEATIKGYKNNVGFYKRSQDLKYIEDITEESIRSFFLNGRVNRNWKSSTYLCYYKSIIVFINWCFKEKYLKGENFMPRIETPKLEKSLPKRLVTKDALRILEVVQNYPHSDPFLTYRNHAIFAMFIHAGLRKRELLHLKCSDVDIDNLSIFVRLGKGNKDRIIPMSYTLAHILKEYLRERKRLRKTCTEFFTMYRTDKAFTVSGLQNVRMRTEKACGIKFTIHKLRHTFATMMIEGGCDIYSLSKMMGHSEISTTTIYLSASVEHLRSQMIKHPLN